MNPRAKRNRAPYLLLLPSVIYLVLFFAWPMINSLTLAFRTEDTILNLRAGPGLSSATVGLLPRGSEVDILDVQGIAIEHPEEATDAIIDHWYHIRGVNTEGQMVEGWAINRRISEDTSWFRVRTLDTATPVEGWVVDSTIRETRSETWYHVLGNDSGGQSIEGWAVSNTIDQNAEEPTLGTVTADALDLRAEASAASAAVGQLPAGTEVEILEDTRIEPNTGTTRRDAVEVRAEPDPTAEVANLLADDTPLEILEKVTIQPSVGSVNRSELNVRAEPGPAAEIVGVLPEDAAVEILERAQVEIWYRISGVNDSGETVEGWARSRHISAFNPPEGQTVSTRGRIDTGDQGQWTLEFIQNMFNDREFDDALITTLLLMVFILPIQFVLAIIMALVLQERLRGNTFFLYIFSIPLGISDLATGLVWFSIFQERGFLNSILTGLGLIERPITFIDVNTLHWIILAVILAEVWRATSIVMVIVVSGLQAVPQDYLEAAELFGANLWQRLRHVILPLLKPSLQVALILRTILAFQVFAVVIAIAGRGLTVLARETYEWYADLRNPHMAAAYAGFILVISMITAMFYLRTVRTQQEKEMAQ